MRTRYLSLTGAGALLTVAIIAVCIQKSQDASSHPSPSVLAYSSSFQQQINPLWPEYFAKRNEAADIYRPEKIQNPAPKRKKKTRQNTLPGTEETVVKPPFPGYEEPMEVHIISADDGGEFSYRTGSRVTIPAGALLHRNGTPVTGDAEIHYREFHSVKDIFFSGIPMKCGNENGEDQYFETAGMPEIRAMQKGEDLLLHPQKPVTLAMISENESPDFNLYALNEKNGEWKDYGKPKVVKNTCLYGVIEKYNLAFDLRENYHLSFFPNKYAIRYAGSRNKIFFSIEKSSRQSKQDETKALNELSFEVLGMSKRQFMKGIRETFGVKIYRSGDLKAGDGAWRDIEIIPQKGSKSVQVVLRKGYKEFSFEAMPYLRHKNQGRALTKRINNYIKQRDEAVKVKNEGQVHVSRQNCYTLNGTDYVGSPGSHTANAIQREFSVRNFGIWNCDRPQVLPAGAKVVASFDVPGGFVPQHVKLVDFEKNAVFTYYNYAFQEFKLNPASKNMIWVQLPDNTIACILPEEMDKLDFTGKKVTIPMRKYELDDFLKIIESAAGEILQKKEEKAG